MFSRCDASYKMAAQFAEMQKAKELRAKKLAAKAKAKSSITSDITEASSASFGADDLNLTVRGEPSSVWGDEVYTKPTWSETCRLKAMAHVTANIVDQEAKAKTLLRQLDHFKQLLAARIESQCMLGVVLSTNQVLKCEAEVETVNTALKKLRLLLMEVESGEEPKDYTRQVDNILSADPVAPRKFNVKTDDKVAIWDEAHRVAGSMLSN